MIVVSAAEANGEFAPTYSHPVLLERTPVCHPDVYSDGLMLTLLDSRPCRAGETTTNNQHTNTHHPSPTLTTKPAPTTHRRHPHPHHQCGTTHPPRHQYPLHLGLSQLLHQHQRTESKQAGSRARCSDIHHHPHNTNTHPTPLPYSTPIPTNAACLTV